MEIFNFGSNTNYSCVYDNTHSIWYNTISFPQKMKRKFKGNSSSHRNHKVTFLLHCLLLFSFCLAIFHNLFRITEKLNPGWEKRSWFGWHVSFKNVWPIIASDCLHSEIEREILLKIHFNQKQHGLTITTFGIAVLVSLIQIEYSEWKSYLVVLKAIILLEFEEYHLKLAHFNVQT